MRVKIGGLDIFDVSVDELEEIMVRFGIKVPIEDHHFSVDGVNSSPYKITREPSVSPSRDLVVLERFIDAGSTGVPVTELGHIFGKQGKAIRSTVQEWAERVLGIDGTFEPWEITRIGTQRGYRLKPAMLEVAKMLATSMRPVPRSGGA